MKAKRHTPSQVIRKLREAERMLGEGKTVPEVAKGLEVSENTFHRWRNQYGGMKANDAKGLKELERENVQLKRLVADKELEIFASRVNFRPPARKGEGRGDPIDAGSPVTVHGNDLYLRRATFCTRRVVGHHSYRLSADRGRLSLTPVQDRCDIRAKLLSAKAWRRVSDKPAAVEDR